MTDREAFEAWYGVEMPPRFNQSGKYCRELVESMWCAWQAAIKQEREACALACDFISTDGIDSTEPNDPDIRQIVTGTFCACAIRDRSEEKP